MWERKTVSAKRWRRYWCILRGGHWPLLVQVREEGGAIVWYNVCWRCGHHWPIKAE